jgi:signal transduction histidine kinase
VTVSCDDGRIIQVLTNLLSNASKYSPPGSDVTLTMRAQGSHVRLVVRDRGIGISKQDQEKLFTPFFRVDNVHTRAVSGTGLGLVIARRLVEMHGGALTVSSEVAHGSEFAVTLPMLSTGEGEAAA